MVRRPVRLAIAFVIAPIAASIIVGSVFAAAFVSGFSEDPIDAAEALQKWRGFGIASSAFAIIFAVPTSLTVGLAAHAFFQAKRTTGWWSYVFAGAAAGIIVPAIAFQSPALGLWGVLVGAISAWLSWLIRRPDRD